MAADSTVRVVFLGNSASAVRSVKTLEGSFGSLGRAAKIATAAIGVGVVGGLAAAVKAALSFDKAMRNVNSIAKLSEQQFQKLSKSVLALAKDTGQAPTKLAEGMYDIVSSGFKANDALKILRVSAKAATAGLTDTATATKAVVAVLNAYHLGAEKAGKVSDILFQTVNKGVLTFEELSSQIGDVLPIAAQLGVPLEDIGGAMATITLHGVNAAEAATQLKQTLVSILKPSEDLNEQIHKMGFETGEAALQTLGLEGFMRKLTAEARGSGAAFADWFPNVRAMNGALGLSGKNIKTLHENIEAMNRSSGATSAAFAEQGKSISVQWQRAKAALVAAAIPVGQLLFPLLAAGAKKVAEFANSIQTHMPQIRAQFGDVAGAAQDLAGGLAEIARAREGQTALVALASGFAGGKATAGIMSFVASLRGVHPAVALVGGAFALLGGAAFLAMTHVSDTEQAMNKAAAAALRLRSAVHSLAQAKLTAKQAAVQLETAELQLEAAQQQARRAAEQFGNASLQHRQALNSVKIAVNNVAQAQKNLKDSNEAVTRSSEQQTRASHDKRAALAEAHAEAKKAADRFRDFAGQVKRSGEFAGPFHEHLSELNRDLANQAARDYAAGIAAVTKAMGGTKAEAQRARAAVLDLIQTLGRIPTSREVAIYVRVIQSGSVAGAIARQERGRPDTTRALGGFVPGVQGEPVIVQAHAGEMILNRSQQMMLGGAHALADFFGFRGERGPSFAAGGIVGGKSLPIPGGGRRSRTSPHRPRKPRAYKASSAAARKALAALDEINALEDAADTTYGLKAREFDLTREEFILTDEDGNETVDVAAVAQRLSEIDTLLGYRQTMVDLIDEERRRLERAIEALKQAIADLQKAIREEEQAAKRERQLVTEQIRQINAKRHQIAQERRKKKPDQKFIDRLENEIDAHEKLRDRHRDRAQGHDSKAGDLRSEVTSFQGDLADWTRFFDLGIGNERRSVELDMMELQNERRDVAGTKARPRETAGGEGGGGGTGGFAEFGGSGDDSALRDEIARLLEEIGRYRLALGIEGVQLGVIGAFAKGTLNVPATGLALVHAGEQIVPAGQVRGGDGASFDDSHHLIELDLGEPLNSLVDSRVMRLTPQISVAIGNAADSRRRSGRS